MKTQVGQCGRWGLLTREGNSWAVGRSWFYDLDSTRFQQGGPSDSEPLPLIVCKCSPLSHSKQRDHCCAVPEQCEVPGVSACSSRDVMEGIQAAENSGDRVRDGVV